MKKIVSQTLFDKIWNHHSIGARDDGKHLLYVDRHVIHELHVPHAFSSFESNDRAIYQRNKTVIVQDHTVPTRPGLSLTSDHIKKARYYANKYQIKLIEVDSNEHGIVHIVSAEQGYALPGLTLACPDSHASTVGALGCLAFGCGTSELEHVLATQSLLIEKPKQMLVELTGQMPLGVGAKDIALHLIRTVGVNAGRGFAIEFTGSIVRAMSIEERMTLCNMTIEWGGRTSLISPDDKTISYCESKVQCLSQEQIHLLLKYWDSLKSDFNAKFDVHHKIDCGQLTPQITWGTDPSQVIGIDGKIPTFIDAPLNVKSQAEKALEYMTLKPEQPLNGLMIDRVFIGSCSNSRISDLRAIANIIKGRHVASHVKAIIVPGSTSIKKQAESEGLDKIFLEAGFEWHNSGCSMCAGANGEVGNFGERCISTSNRNYENRQGRGVRTHLASPMLAAASAINGCVTDPRIFL